MENGRSKKPAILLWVQLIVLLNSNVTAMNISGPFDINNNTLNEILLFHKTELKYIEINANGSHEVFWRFEPDGRVIKDAMVYDLHDDGSHELIILTDPIPGNRIKGESWINIFSWSDSTFSEVDLSLDNGDLFHVNNGDVDSYSGILSASVGTPFRAAVLLQTQVSVDTLHGNTVYIDLPERLQNGYGPLFANFMNVSGEPHLTVFSPENNQLNAAIISSNDELKVLDENVFSLDSAQHLIGSAIQKTDLNQDNIEELHLPFSSGHVKTLSFVDSVLILTESVLNDLSIFVIPDTADEATINALVDARIDAGLYDIEEEPEIIIIPNDTLRLGDTLIYHAAMDTTSGFYSFHWLAPPPDSAIFDPSTGLITWIPQRENLGTHEFRFFAEQRLKEELISDVDALGDRHRIVPVIEEEERSYAVIVVDTTAPPIVYEPPPYEPFSVSVHTPSKEEGKERFLFDGEPSFHLSVDALPIPKYPSTTHFMGIDLGYVDSDKFAEFSYVSEPDSGTTLSTMTLVHDLGTNEFSASLDPHIDSANVELDPSNWRNDLVHFPSYSFSGFPESMRLGEDENGISLFESQKELKTKKNSYISVQTPLSENRHRLSISGRAIELWNMTGTISIDSIGNKTVTSTITFSGDLYIDNMKSEMYTDADLAARMKELQNKRLEFMGVDSVAVDSSEVME